MELNYVITEERGLPSFDPLHSDTMLNYYFVEQLVGTLVKYGFDSTPEACLAHSWEASKDQLTYSFQLRDGIQCEDGTPITAEAYHANLLRLIKLYTANNKSLPVFGHLIGIEPFANGTADSISGMTFQGNELRFQFSSIPDGILAFLSMPYYGFYCDSNFDKSGQWKDSHKIVSSGPWKLTSFTSESIKLARRDDWHKQPVARVADSVSIRMMDFDAAKHLPPHRTIIQKRIETTADIPSGFKKFLSVPNDLKAIVLSPIRKGPFQNPAIRRYFRCVIHELLEDKPMPSETARRTRSFYTGQESVLENRCNDILASSDQLEHQELVRWKNYEILVITNNAYTTAEKTYAEGALSAAASRLGMRIRFEPEDRSKPGWKERLDLLEDMDIRVVRVSAGPSYEPWVARMMFCSKMGVSFPDPSGRIDKLTSSLVDRSTQIANQLEKVIEEDAAVIPLFHTSFSWVVTNDLNLDAVSPTSDLLRFETIGVK